ncbi:hypothetical protein [Piscibacillus halophilus]|uniref:Uncharacterized protein n=1 Tax=Piscibacillus halophilus TaxID=571933 RepID=A0A1H8ZQ03_9BACI|nr:hypothetical protein [Piscibacillus halophilus]SEP66377.1 hypothetical protein SAMN05216362_10243 [Piscibacillus halophilus]
MKYPNNKEYLLESLQRLEIELEHLKKRMQMVNPDMKRNDSVSQKFMVK